MGSRSSAHRRAAWDLICEPGIRSEPADRRREPRRRRSQDNRGREGVKLGYDELHFRQVKGRKDYSCEWCSEAIPKGTAHFYRVYVSDGDFNYGRLHRECEDAMSKVPNDELAEGWTPGDYKRGSGEPRC